ncbi:Gldg family protein [Pseudobacter ginsenosidimutans]|jgi:ABC-2 type transport system permease protein|nr:Gldg family protein [Pseudobacter ginsenosidimutans]
MIFKIARTELRNLFYSPVAWFLSLIFLIMCAVLFTGVLEPLAKAQDMALKNMPKFKDFGGSLTSTIFIKGGLFDTVLNNLYLFIPLLTMGVISREMNNGTVKLLYSSPVKVRQIVLGKYLAIMLYNVLLLLLLGIFIVSGLFNIKSPDYGLLLAGCLGFYLVICAFTAFGMFMSSLSNYQVVSALATFMVIFVLSKIGGLWQKYDFVRDLTYFLSLEGRAGTFLDGLITTRDVSYFILIVGMFIAFTILKLKFSRMLLPWYKKAAAYTAVFMIVLALGYLTSRPGYVGYWDTTARKLNTIHPRTQQVMASLGDEPVEVTLYTNLIGGGAGRALPENRQEYVWKVWDPYVRFKPDINLKYVLYYDQKDGDSTQYKRYPGKSLKEIAEQASELSGYPMNKFMPPSAIRKMMDLQPEDLRAVMQLKYKGRTVFLRTYDDPIFWPNEEHFAAAFKWLAEGKGPKIYFTSADLERSIYKKGEREYYHLTLGKLSRNALINHGYMIDTLSLDEQEVPADADALVVADPKTELSALSQSRISHYLQRGGNMVFAGEPGKQEMLNPVLKPLGVQLGKGTVVEITKDEMPHMVVPYITWPATDLADDGRLLAQKVKLARQLDTLRALHPGVVNLEIADSGFSVKHLLVTKDRNAWVKAGKLVTDSATPVFSAQEGDYTIDSVSTLISLNRKLGTKDQRIIIAGDADFLSRIRGQNGFLWNAFNGWMNHNSFPIYVPRKEPLDVLLTIGPKPAKLMQVIYVWILPGLLLLTGIILLVRRKRK